MLPVKQGLGDCRLAGIEAIRFCAALTVVIRHYLFLLNSPQQDAFAHAHPLLSSLFFASYGYGYFGVLVFWLLSGFIFFYNYLGPIVAKKVSGREFFILRFSRLYPLHFVTLLVVAALQAIHMARNGHYFVFPINDLKHFLLHLGFASNWELSKMPVFSFNAPVWSVSVEVVIYGVFLFWALFVRPSLVKTLAVVVCAYGGYRLTLPGSTFFLCTSLFYTGGVISQFLDTYEAWMEKYKTRSIVACVAMMAILSGGIVLLADQMDKFIAMTGIICVLLVLSYQYRFTFTGRVAQCMNWLGRLTYASYLLHFPLQLAVIVICQTLGWRTMSFTTGGCSCFTSLRFSRYRISSLLILRVRLKPISASTGCRLSITGKRMTKAE